ncbi:MAG TPA: hypothetical protein VFP00_09725, partial [Burkholderiales bacterium]|nr:hypothetical protein [Burkholderiales bacterium]
DHNGEDGAGLPLGSGTRLLWRTEQDEKLVELQVEPIRSPWQRIIVDFLLALPLDVLVGEADYH